MKTQKPILLLILLLILIPNCKGKEDTINFIPTDKYDLAIVNWVEVFQPSALSRQERLEELLWFKEKAKVFRGKKIKTVAENIDTHYWESRVLARAFFEITGIEVEHEIIGEGDVVTRIMDQIENGTLWYDAYVNDADMVGTHLRTQGVEVISDYMKKEGKEFTNPNLDLNDFLNLEFGQ